MIERLSRTVPLVQSIDSIDSQEPEPASMPRPLSLAMPLLIVTLVLASTVRVIRVASANFPLGDGGLFYLMVGDLQRSHFVLPAVVNYDGKHLPFSYPPFGFYA